MPPGRLPKKALVVTLIRGDTLSLSHPFVWLVRHACSVKAEFSFFVKEDRFLTLLNVYQLSFVLSDILVITVIVRNKIVALS